MTFQRLKLSWRHLGAILWKSTYDHIFITESNFSFIIIMNEDQYPSGQFQVNKRAQMSACAFVRAFTRAQKFKMLQIIPIFFYIRFRPYGAFDKKITHTRMRARFLRVLAFCNIESPNFLYHHIWHIFPSILITCSPFNNAMSVRQSWQRARTCVIFIHNTWAKTWLYKILCNSSEWIGNSQYFFIFR